MRGPFPKHNGSNGSGRDCPAAGSPVCGGLKRGGPQRRGAGLISRPVSRAGLRPVLRAGLGLLLCLILQAVPPLWPAGAVAHAAGPLSFSGARGLLHERSDALKASAANAESKQEASDALKWLHGPTITAQAFEVWGETRVDIDKSISTPLGPMPVDIDEHYNFSGPRASVTGTLPIFTGGKIGAAQKSARYAAEEAREQNRAQGVELDAQLIGKYFGLQLARSVELLRKRTLEQEERELERARAFERQGMISRVERMSVQVSRDAARREWLKARDNARVARLELERLLQDNTFGALTTPLFVLKKPLEPMERWVEAAVGNNPQIAVIEARMQQANQGVEASKSSWSPQIFAFGQYSFIRHYQTMIEPNWVAGLGLNLTLWDSTDRLSSYRSARATLRQAKAIRADAVNQVRTGAEVAWLNTQNAIEQYRLSASDVTLARENLELKSKGFGEGLSTALDVNQARDQLLKAEVGRRVAAFEFVVNYAMLHAIAGTMDDFITAYEHHDVIVEH